MARKVSIKKGDKVRLIRGGLTGNEMDCRGRNLRVRSVRGGLCWCLYTDPDGDEVEIELKVTDVEVVNNIGLKGDVTLVGGGENRVADESHPQYRAGWASYLLNVRTEDCPIKHRAEFDDGRFHWLAGWYAARTDATVRKLVAPSIKPRMAAIMDTD